MRIFGIWFLLAAVVAADEPRVFIEPVTVVQKRVEKLPLGGLTVRLGDITGGQTFLSVRHPAGKDLVSNKVVREGDVVRFKYFQHDFQLAVVRLVNKLVGDDYVVLLLTQAKLAGPLQVEALLRALEAVNPRVELKGEKATATEAGRSLRAAWKKSGGKTVADFIKLTAASGWAKSIPGAEPRPLAHLFKKQAQSFFPPEKK